MTTQDRTIIFHKHPVSAKVRFLKQQYGGICGFNPLPDLAVVLDDETLDKEENIVSHPSHITRNAEEKLQLSEGSLKIESEYFQKVDIPKGMVNVYLVGIVGHDTPDAILAEQGMSLNLITEMRDLSPTEMELLRRAYVAIMEG